MKVKASVRICKQQSYYISLFDVCRDAWNKLGQMSQEDAMCAYIREMKKVAQKVIHIPANFITIEQKVFFIHGNLSDSSFCRLVSTWRVTIKTEQFYYNSPNAV